MGQQQAGVRDGGRRAVGGVGDGQGGPAADAGDAAPFFAVARAEGTGHVQHRFHGFNARQTPDLVQHGRVRIAREHKVVVTAQHLVELLRDQRIHGVREAEGQHHDGGSHGGGKDSDRGAAFASRHLAQDHLPLDIQPPPEGAPAFKEHHTALARRRRSHGLGGSQPYALPGAIQSPQQADQRGEGQSRQDKPGVGPVDEQGEGEEFQVGVGHEARQPESQGATDATPGNPGCRSVLEKMRHQGPVAVAQRLERADDDPLLFDQARDQDVEYERRDDEKEEGKHVGHTRKFP